MKKFAIIEIGSNNTKTHVYEDGNVIYENTTTIKLKANYKENDEVTYYYEGFLTDAQRQTLINRNIKLRIIDPVIPVFLWKNRRRFIENENYETAVLCRSGADHGRAQRDHPDNRVRGCDRRRLPAER